VELEDFSTGARPIAKSFGRQSFTRQPKRVWAVVGACAVAAIGSLAWGFSRRPVAASLPLQMTVLVPAGVTLPMETDHRVLAVSPDGATLVFVGEDRGVTRLYKRAFADRNAVLIGGTENARAPFFSPDGAWIGYFDGNMLKRVAVAGGLPEPVSA